MLKLLMVKIYINWYFRSAFYEIYLLNIRFETDELSNVIEVNHLLKIKENNSLGAFLKVPEMK